MRFLFALFTCLLLFGPQAWGEQRSSRTESFVDRGKKAFTVWQNIPFYAGGDIAQYEATMAQNREQVRKALFSDLMQALNQSASSGANVEAMVEPLANIIVVFDKMHDVHKARDLNRINFSIESQFKAALDAV